MPTSENSHKAKFAEFTFYALRRIGIIGLFPYRLLRNRGISPRGVRIVGTRRPRQRQTRRQAGVQSLSGLPRREAAGPPKWSIMPSSGYTQPATSKYLQRPQEDPARDFYESRFGPRLVAQEEGLIVRSYERFLELPVAFVLGAMWLAGVELLGSCALTLYLSGSLLVHVLS